MSVWGGRRLDNSDSCLCVVSGLVQSVTDVISSVIIVSRRHHVTSRDQQLYLRQGGCFSRRSLLAEIS